MPIDAGALETADPLPDRFHAAWERSELAIDGELATDAGRAIWVQAGTLYVDVRGPGGFASDTCFAGTTKWREPHLAWTHLIDRAGPEDGADEGHITFDGDDLIEQGGFIAGAEHRYHERWTPLAGARAPLLAATAGDGISVRVGDHAAAVIDARAIAGPFAAAYWRLDTASATWQLELAVDGDITLLPPPLEPGARLPDGWTWITDGEVGA
jgi:hypothetical protein